MRLLVVADDYGRFDADPVVMFHECFKRGAPGWDQNRVAQVFPELCVIGLTDKYHVGHDDIGLICGWRQRLRAKEPKFPGPPDGHVSVTRQSSAHVVVVGDVVVGEGEGVVDRPRSPVSESGASVYRPDPPAYVVSCPSCTAMLRLVNDLSARGYTAPGQTGDQLHRAHQGRPLQAVLAALKRHVGHVNRRGKSHLLAPTWWAKPENWDRIVNDLEPDEERPLTSAELLGEA